MAKKRATISNKGSKKKTPSKRIVKEKPKPKKANIIEVAPKPKIYEITPHFTNKENWNFRVSNAPETLLILLKGKKMAKNWMALSTLLSSKNAPINGAKK